MNLTPSTPAQTNEEQNQNYKLKKIRPTLYKYINKTDFFYIEKYSF